MEIRQATTADIHGIFDLLKRYHRDTIAPEDRADGFVTTQMSLRKMTSLIELHDGVTVIERGGNIQGFALAAPWSFWQEWPLFAHMIAILPQHQFCGQPLDVETSYQYGPICIDKSLRGTGGFQELFRASLKNMESRFPVMVTFVNQINPRSYEAHSRKVGMETVGTFDFNENQYYLMACSTATLDGGDAV